MSKMTPQWHHNWHHHWLRYGTTIDSTVPPLCLHCASLVTLLRDTTSDTFPSFDIFVIFLNFALFSWFSWILHFFVIFPRNSGDWVARTHTTGWYTGSHRPRYPLPRVPLHHVPEHAHDYTGRSAVSQRCLRGWTRFTRLLSVTAGWSKYQLV